MEADCEELDQASGRNRLECSERIAAGIRPQALMNLADARCRRIHRDPRCSSSETPPEGIQGYPELPIGGAGFCFAVWRWDGRTYNHLRNGDDYNHASR